MSISMMEHVGRTVSGLGLALLFIQSIANMATFKKHWIKFVPVILIVSVMVSFYGQNKIVEYVVSNSSLEKQTQALLISRVNTTLVPFYADDDDLVAFNPWLRLLTFNGMAWPGMAEKLDANNIKRAKFYDRVKRCTNSEQFNAQSFFNVHTRIDRGFFSYTSIQHPADEAAYKSAWGQFVFCLEGKENIIEKQQSAIEQTKLDIDAKLAAEIDKIKREGSPEIAELYRKYKKGSSLYNLSQKRVRLGKANLEWREQTDIYFGFTTTIPPNLSYYDFLEHPDVKKLILIASGVDLTPLEHGVSTDDEIIDALPDMTLPEYNKFKTAALQKDSTDLSLEEINLAKESYKAIVIPMIALIASLFFLGWNIISITIRFIFACLPTKFNSNKAKIATNLGLLSLFIFLPYIVKPIFYQSRSDAVVQQTKDPYAYWAYFYQTILLNLTDSPKENRELP